jgi:PAS domain S-box-containing protein
MLIPTMLISIARTRKDIPFNFMFWMFAVFILSCGCTHLIGAAEFALPIYGIGALVNLFTAISSWVTIIYLVPLKPKLLLIKSPEELQELNNKLIENEERVKAVGDSVIEAIVTADENGIILNCNKSARNIFGYTYLQLLGQDTKMLMPEKYRAAHSMALKRLKQGNEPVLLGKLLELEGLRSDGSIFPLELSIVKSTIKDQILYTAVMRDITARKQAEEKIHQLNDTLKTRLEAAEAFNQMAIHDLNAPLRSLEGFSEILVEDVSTDKIAQTELLDYIHRIRVSAIKMRQLIQDMGRLAKVTQAEMKLNIQYVSLTAMAQDIIYEHKMAYPKSATLHINIQENLCAHVDADLFRLGLYNIISNAWKFTGHKDYVEIEFGAKLINGETVYYVKDNGAGFDQTKVHKLFQPFQRLHSQDEFSGNGIGLTIVKRVVTIHRGRVWAEGEVGKGATFYFTIGTENAK